MWIYLPSLCDLHTPNVPRNRRILIIRAIGRYSPLCSPIDVCVIHFSTRYHRWAKAFFRPACILYRQGQSSFFAAASQVKREDRLIRAAADACHGMFGMLRSLFLLRTWFCYFEENSVRMHSKYNITGEVWEHAF